MSNLLTFIIVDDDLLNNKLCHYLIRKVAPANTDVFDFASPEAALSFIETTYSGNDFRPTILLLDTNMPNYNGWEFLDRYKTFSEHIRNQISVYMVSSSIDRRDKQKASDHESIHGYIEKPMSVRSLQEVMRSVLLLT